MTFDRLHATRISKSQSSPGNFRPGYNGSVARLHYFAFLAIFNTSAQTAVPIPFACTAEDIEHFGLNCSAEQPCPVYADPQFRRIRRRASVHNRQSSHRRG